MKTHFTRIFGLTAAVALIATLAFGAGTANAATICTFADPAADGSTPLFELDGTTFSGGWLNGGLTLQTPGLPAPDFTDVTFTMTDLTLSDPVNNPQDLSGGNVQFFDGATMIFRVDFNSAQLYVPIAFGATEFLSLNVVGFSGPIVTFPLTDESFAFSFANQLATATGFTTTASFTSSAVPEPAALSLLGLAGLSRSVADASEPPRQEQQRAASDTPKRSAFTRRRSASPWGGGPGSFPSECRTYGSLGVFPGPARGLGRHSRR